MRLGSFVCFGARRSAITCVGKDGGWGDAWVIDALRMGCGWVVDGLWMGCRWVVDGLRMGYKWSVNGAAAVRPGSFVGSRARRRAKACVGVYG